ncbi:MAG: single-stranded DNA-binding protein [Thermoflexales bacterium]|nr:single-stranded DNA-binding protein [Thermoflexales bacterium]
MVNNNIVVLGTLSKPPVTKEVDGKPITLVIVGVPNGKGTQFYECKLFSHASDLVGIQPEGVTALISGQMVRETVETASGEQKRWRVHAYQAVVMPGSEEPVGFSHCVVIGRLGKDPEVKYSAEGKAYGWSSLAASNGKDEEPTWFDVKAFGRTAETLNYGAKGRLVAVEGRFVSETYEKDGETRTAWKVIADTIQFLDSRKTADAETDESLDSIPEDQIPF